MTANSADLVRFSRRCKKQLLLLGVFFLVSLVAATAALAQNYSTSGKYVLDPNGKIYYIHGVARSSFEVSSSGDGHFTQTDFNTIASTWKANTVRIATNQDFLLSDSSCFDANYLGRLDAAVTAAHNAGLNVIFDLHWNDAGQAGVCANGQQMMADTRSLTFWQIMANHYKNDPKVFFELYNEPHGISWSCWLNGCSPWVGMQQMYNTVRNAGFNNLVIMGGLNFAYDLSGVPNNRPQGFGIVFATHPYDFSGKQPADWPTGFGFLTATDPVIATEGGDFNCTSGYTTQLVDYLDAPSGDITRRAGFTGWAWNSPGSCGFPSIINDFNGTPSTMGQPEHDHMVGYTTSPPTPPANLSATAGNGQVALSWLGVAEASSYDVNRSTTNGGPYTTVASGVTATNFTDTGLNAGTTYFYVVTGVNGNGVSLNSNQASATPTGGGSPDFTISISPSSTTVTQGSNASYTVSIGSSNGFNGTVSLSASGLPSGATDSFNPASITTSGNSTLTISTTGSTSTGSFTISVTGTSGSLSHSASATLVVQAAGGGGTPVFQISAGNTSGAGGIAPFVADEDFSGGTAVLHSVTVDTSHVTNPAPQAVYQYERYGNASNFSYTLPGLTAGANYTVRLHFAETFFTTTGQRIFNVSINGTQVLSNFDIVAAAGAANRAVIEQFTATANSSGQIAIAINLGSANNPKIDGIEVITAGGTAPAAPTNLTATAGNTQVSLSWTASSGATSYNVKRSTTSGGPYSNVATGVTSTNFTDTGLTNGTTYFYVVSAVNGSGESANSNQASATPTSSGSGNAHTGTFSVKGVLTSTASFKNFSQIPNAAGNSTYVASIWIKGTGSVQLEVKAGNWGANLASMRCDATSSWTQCFTPSFSTGSNSQLTYIIQDSYGTAGTVFLDDAFLGVSGGTNILANPSFESGSSSWSFNGTVFTVGQF